MKHYYPLLVILAKVKKLIWLCWNNMVTLISVIGRAVLVDGWRGFKEQARQDQNGEKLCSGLSYGVKQQLIVFQWALTFFVLLSSTVTWAHINAKLLVLQGTNAELGSVTSSTNIIDKTATNPHILVITIGDGTIYYNGSVSISVSLPVGVTAAEPIKVSLVRGAGSNLGDVPIPTFPTSVSIPKNSNVGYFNVSGINTSDAPATLVLEGSASGFKFNPGTITIFNKRIQEFMSISANGDGIHDYSEINNIEKYPDNEVDIVDRWGVLVWRAKRYNNRDIKFIGKSNQGHPSKLSDDIYYYVIRFYDENGELNIFKGSLQLKSGISEH